MLHKLFNYSVDTGKEKNLYRACICFPILIEYCLNHIYKIQSVILLTIYCCNIRCVFYVMMSLHS